MSAGQCDEKDRLVLDTAERQELYSAAVAELSRRIGITSLDETHAFGRRAAVLGSFLCWAISADVRLMETGTIPEHPTTRHFKVS